MITSGKINKNILLIKKNYTLYLFLLPAIILYFCFYYIPIYGVQIAFKNYSPAAGITGSPWVGFTHFLRFFRTNQFKVVISNTLILSLYGLIAGFPMPIILALIMNSIKSNKFKRVLQTVTYLPHFISTVVFVSMILLFLSPSGLFGQISRLMGSTPGNIMGEAYMFPHIYVWSGIWQQIGWSSIIYLAALSSIDPTLYEAATIDGASKWQKIIQIEIPSIMPTCIILLILNAGNILNVSFEKTFLLQNSLNLSRSEVITTYIYKIGIQSTQYSFSAAVGLFNNIINFIVLALVNYISGKLSETNLW
ncbi:MAG: ABC transporter permease subunit [Treponema sp.]|nr:ABC transporter permease subunit [Treponema sp.]